MKCVLSETIFANLANYHGANQMFIQADMDSNGWPQTGRNKALDVIRRGFGFMYAGDQHLTSIVHHGIDEQGKITTNCQKLLTLGEPHALLKSAAAQLAAATSAMQLDEREAIKSSQAVALQTLRHFIIEQALILETAVPPRAAQDPDPAASSEGSDSESELSAGFISEFVSGEAPKDQESVWKVRGDRNRAALNQNFARELPLEYRGLLKNYYERVTK